MVTLGPALNLPNTSLNQASTSTSTDAKLAEQNQKLTIQLTSAAIGAGIAYVTHRGLSHWTDTGKLFAFCKQLDQRFSFLNAALTSVKWPNNGCLNKVLTKSNPAIMVQDAITPLVKDVLDWAKTHLPKSYSNQWKTRLSPVKTPEALTDALYMLRGSLGRPIAINTATTPLKPTAALPLLEKIKNPKQALAQLRGLQKRVVDGLKPRYFQPYQHTFNLVNKHNLKPVGQSFLHFTQGLNQLVGGDFAGQTLGQKPGVLTTLINGGLIFQQPVQALLQADKEDKLKSAGEELWGNAFGNFLGWYWGSQWINHSGVVPKLLNAFKPGMAVKPILGGLTTWTGFLTEFLAAYGIGSVVANVGKSASHAVLGTPRNWITPKLPSGYVPLLKRLTISEAMATKGRITQLSDTDIKNLMTNPNQIHEQQQVNLMKPGAELILQPAD